ncbi:MAG: universal stress protein [Candidatus Tectomicrobia bacterium]|uniref:Universal stress protein n=1 Tax=Tectimicrobiota bacterium TaxID=2528274 RepID=A0A932FWI6_UNCTE|nr:universal stress protein [Candidatus Tectomicrobia bacterium]
MVKKILVATGGSPWSERAVNYAIQFARNYQAELVFLCVVTPEFIAKKAAAWGIASASDIEEVKKKEGEEILNRVCLQARENGVTYQPHLCVCGQPAAQEIVQTAREYNCDFIVIGSRGTNRRGERITLHKIGNEVIEKAHCPVMVVK